MKFLIDKLHQIEEFENSIKDIQQGRVPVGIRGINDSALPYFLYAYANGLADSLLIITPNDTKAKDVFEHIRSMEEGEFVYLPIREPLLHEVEAKSQTREFQRVNVLDRLYRKDYDICVTSMEALLMKVASPKVFTSMIKSFEVGQIHDMDDLAEKFVEMGYENSHMVEHVGQFSKRGDIFDIFSPGQDQPVRIEFFGDEIDLIRYFDMDSQRSTETVEKVRILPCTEQVLSEQQLQQVKERSGRSILNPMDRYFPLAEDLSTALSYIQPQTRIGVVNDLQCKKNMDQRLEMYYGQCEKFIEQDKMKADAWALYETMDNQNTPILPDIVLPELISVETHFRLEKEYTISTRENTHYRGNMKLLTEDLIRWKKEKRKVIVFAPNEKSAHILLDFFIENKINAYHTIEKDFVVKEGETAVVVGGLEEGFEIPKAGLCFMGSGRIFRRADQKSQKRKKGKDMELYASLKAGDYVVHEVHGIGKYVGIEQIEAGGIKKDYLKVLYKNQDTLYIPVSKMNLIQKYIGADGRAPALHRLGSKEWENTKGKAKQSVKKLAFELVELYAKRQAVKGFSFSSDTVWQVAFEEEFPYEETPDQLRCIEEIKDDMESNKVMDRLLCGDVGFGKTEVALRAVFKAAMDGKQVAFLVPTTVLAYQHYNNFVKRMQNYPVNIGLLSRFRTKTQQKETIAQLKQGNIDVVVGTHRILQKDIHFKDLGLLVIDEEQRFGVEHKEKMKNMKSDVDVLTLTATPIPRTLHMSMSGIRDISIIEDPPGDRFPVQTFVMEYDEDVIKDAVEREKARGGQVFYLYNRVKGIESKYANLKNLFEEDVRIGIAHGQMAEGKLEKTMVSFMDGEYDVLLCTTIVESGLDMPNVNTLVIEDAHRMGLSQLYQIRGRVGRSNKVAYAYVTHKRNTNINEDAAKRLEAIREFTEFGSGFKIAMRDLEIRGAGNILGANQHGHMERVGYDLYIRLLQNAIEEITGETKPVESKEDAAIDIPMDAYINRSYIQNSIHRMEMYRKISSLSGEEEKSDLIDELTDRFGDIPKEVLSLVEIGLIKHYATQCGLERIFESGKKAIFLYHANANPNLGTLVETFQKMDEKILLKADKGYGFTMTTLEDKNELLVKIKKILESVMQIQ